MALAIVRKGEQCMALLESFSNDLNRGHIGSSVEAKLEQLKTCSKELADHAVERASKCEEVEQQCREKVEETQREIGKLGLSEQEVQGDMSQLLGSMSSSTFCKPLAVKLYCDLNYLKRQRMKYNSEALRLKEIVLFFRKSSEFWKEFQVISNVGTNRTLLVQNILKRAQGMDVGRLLQSKGISTTAKTFFEAWKEIETMYGEGVFRIDEENQQMIAN